MHKSNENENITEMSMSWFIPYLVENSNPSINLKKKNWNVS